MNMHNDVAKNRTGNIYKFPLPPVRSIQLNLKPQNIWNDQSTQEFINNLMLPDGQRSTPEIQVSTSTKIAGTTVNEKEIAASKILVHGQTKLHVVNKPDIV